MGKVAALVRLARPKFLAGGFAGYALGVAVAAYAGAPITPGRYAAGQAMVSAFHLMTHFANDYFDRGSDSGAGRTAFSGGSGVLAARALLPRTALAAALVCATAGAAAVLAFAHAGMLTVAAIGAAIGILAWAYSAPPLRLAGRGWGELDTTLVVAVLVPLTGYAVFTGHVDLRIIAATLAPAAAMFAMMIAVEWPDRAADAAGAKRNLLVRLGPRRGAWLAIGGAVLIVPGFLLAIGCGAPGASGAFAALLVPLIAGFGRRIAIAGAPPAEIAARGVTLFFLTVVFAALVYVASLPACSGGCGRDSESPARTAQAVW
jgi:1,4-dihydroxy-2-naphthoate octaprenyltransferase